MTASTIQFATPSEQLPLCKQAEKSLQQDAAGNDANADSSLLEAHIVKMSIVNGRGALNRQFHDIVVAKSEKSIT